MGAAQDAAEQIARAVCPVQLVRGGRFVIVPDCNLALLDPVPERIINDPEFRDIDDDPAALTVHTGFALLGLRVLAELAPVEDQASTIGLVVEDARATVDMSANGRVAPFEATWSGHASPVEFFGDLDRRAPAGIFPENLLNDRCLFGIDLPQTGNAVTLGIGAGIKFQRFVSMRRGSKISLIGPVCRISTTPPAAIISAR
nr:hypothetical protein [Hoeflea phototrophica]